MSAPQWTSERFWFVKFAKRCKVFLKNASFAVIQRESPARKIETGQVLPEYIKITRAQCFWHQDQSFMCFWHQDRAQRSLHGLGFRARIRPSRFVRQLSVTHNTRSPFRSLSHTHTHPPSLSHTHTRTRTLAHSHTHTLSLPQAQEENKKRDEERDKKKVTDKITHSHTHSLSRSHTHSHTLSLSLVHTFSHTHALSGARGEQEAGRGARQEESD